MYSVIYPKPRRVEEFPGSFVFGKEVTLEVSGDFSREEAFPLLREFWKNFTGGAGKLNITKTARTGDFLWTIGAPSPLCLSEEFTYALSIEENGIALRGKDDLSLLHGFYTLLQILYPVNLKEGEEKFAVDCGKIEDAPQLQFRGLHLSMHPDSTLHQFRKYVRFAAFMKFSHISIEFRGNYQFACKKELSWPGSFTKEQLQPIFKEANAMGCEIIPLFNCLGHAGMGNLMNCKHVLLDQNPTLATMFEPTGWSFCWSDPEARQLICDAIDEMIDLCGPGSYFHIGLDEAHDFATCPRCAHRDKGEYLAEFINETAARLRQKGRRTMMWGDMLLYHKQFDPEENHRNGVPDFYVANATDTMPTHTAIDKIDKDVIITDWQYYTHDPETKTSRYFADRGFTVITSSYDNFPNMRMLAESAGKNGFFGYLSTAWGAHKENADLILFSGEAAWLGKDAGQMDTFRLESRFHAVGNLQRKLLPSDGSYAQSGWN